MLTADVLARYEADAAVIADVFPKLKHHILLSRQGAYAAGDVDVDVGAGAFEAVPLHLAFRPPYPLVPPTVYYRGKRWAPNIDRHLMSDRSFCLWLALVDQPDVTRPEELKHFLLGLLPFLRDQFVFDDLGAWPGEEWAHGAEAAYSQHIIETLGLDSPAQLRRLWPYLHGQRRKPANLCPCGSQRPYQDCHQAPVGLLIGLMNQLERVCDLRPTLVHRISQRVSV